MACRLGDSTRWPSLVAYDLKPSQTSHNIESILLNVNTLFGMVFKDMEVERYNLFSSLEDIKRIPEPNIFPG